MILHKHPKIILGALLLIGLFSISALARVTPPPLPTLMPATLTPTASPTPTMTPTAAVAPTASPTPTTAPTAAVSPTAPPGGEPKFHGICIADGPLNKRPQNTGGDIQDISVRFSGFPQFTSWCPSGIQHFLTLSTTGSMLGVDVPPQSFPIRSVFLMATISGSYDSNDHAPVAKIIFSYQSTTFSVQLTPGQNIAHWNYHTQPLYTTSGSTYRVWSGPSTDLKGAGQALALVLDPVQQSYGQDQGPLTAITIQKLNSPLQLDLYGLAVSNLEPGQIEQSIEQQPVLLPLCFEGNQHNAMVRLNPYIRAQVYQELVDVERDYYANQQGNCEQRIDAIGDLPRRLLDSDLRGNLQNQGLLHLPFILGPTIYESRPFKPDPADQYTSLGINPKITIVLSDTQKLDMIYLAISARNLCNTHSAPQIPVARSVIGQIQVYTHTSNAEDRPIFSQPINLVVGENIHQGRSGIAQCDVAMEGSDQHKLDPRKPATQTLISLPLAAQATVDTDQQQVALWADVIAIPINKDVDGSISKIELIDMTAPEPRPLQEGDSNDQDTVDFNDPYLVLYGVTLKPATR